MSRVWEEAVYSFHCRFLTQKIDVCVGGLVISVGCTALKCYQCGGIGGSKQCDLSSSMASFAVDCYPLGRSLPDVLPGREGNLVCFHTVDQKNHETRGCNFLFKGVTTIGCLGDTCLCDTDLCNNAARAGYTTSAMFFMLLALILCIYNV